MAMERATEVVRRDRKSKLPREVVEEFVGAGAIRMRLHRLQRDVAQRNVRRILATTCSALLAGRRCRSCRASSSKPPRRSRLALESYQSAFGDFQLIELVAQHCPFCIEPHEPLRNPLLFLSDLVQYRHLLLSLFTGYRRLFPCASTSRRTQNNPARELRHEIV